jgi:monothiol glutaredoxin
LLTLASPQQHIAENRIMLYMKGNPAMPMCGFSAKVVGVLQEEGADFSSVNVLDYPAIREGVKIFS